MAFERFHYTIPAEQIPGARKDREITLPRFKQIPFGVMRKLRKLSEGEQMFVLLETLAERGQIAESTLEVLDDLPLDAVKDLMDAWAGDSQTSVGESTAS